MDAMTLLKSVAETYANLKTLTVELVCTNESEDDGAMNRSEQRTKAFFTVPYSVRIEQGGRRGSVTVTNGVDHHHYFAAMKRYSKHVARDPDLIPGLFQPKWPAGNAQTFLFPQIAERVAKADFLGDETIGGVQYHVLAVMYEPPPHPHLMELVTPIKFWVDAKTRLISRMAGETSHRMPAHDEVRINKFVFAYMRAVVNEPIPAEIFEYTPPADALDASDPYHRGGFTGGFGGGGGGRASIDPKGNRFEHWSGQDWAGDILIQRSKMKLHGFDLAFERQFILTDDRKEMRIVERIIGPKGQTDREFTIPVA